MEPFLSEACFRIQENVWSLNQCNVQVSKQKWSDSVKRWKYSSGAYIRAKMYNASQKHESTLLHMYVLNEFLTADRSCTAKHFWKNSFRSFKFTYLHFFWHLLRKKLVNYSRHSESLKYVWKSTNRCHRSEIGKSGSFKWNTFKLNSPSLILACDIKLQIFTFKVRLNVQRPVNTTNYQNAKTKGI